MKSIAHGRAKCCNSRNMETLSSNELSNFMICNDSSDTPGQLYATAGGAGGISCSSSSMPAEAVVVVQGRKKRRRRAKVCKNKEEAESQRMTHIAVERNRRKQMNEHLAVLRSLMPESYVQRGDQASIVGGAIEFVKELEHVLQSLEAKKLATLGGGGNDNINCRFSQFFTYPQFSSSSNCKYTSQNKAAIADIEVTLIETHANIRILSRRRIRQHSKIVGAFHTMFLSILHLNLTTFDPFVLYSISAKVEEGCQLNSADEIAGAIHHMLRVIEEEAILSCHS